MTLISPKRVKQMLFLHERSCANTSSTVASAALFLKASFRKSVLNSDVIPKLRKFTSVHYIHASASLDKFVDPLIGVEEAVAVACAELSDVEEKSGINFHVLTLEKFRKKICFCGREKLVRAATGG